MILPLTSSSERGSTNLTPGSNQLTPYIPVVIPNGVSLEYEIEDEVKIYHLVAELVQQEFAPGLVMNTWGYNSRTPGPIIEAVEGDRVRILVTNNLPEATSVNWHGIIGSGIFASLYPRLNILVLKKGSYCTFFR